MKYPNKLKKGAVIGLVSPSSPISEEREEQCKNVIESLGYKVKMSDNIAASKGGFMAGDEKIRGQWINKMFADPEVDAIFCIRGGDGANRIIEYIDLDIIRNNKKIFVGYSDITSLHFLFNQKCDLVTFHGPMVSSNIVDNFDDESKEAFFAALNSDDEYIYKSPANFEVGVAREGKASGIMVGGNLTVMCASLGTSIEMDTKDKIIFIEEIGEHIGNLDRHIYQLRNAGKFDGARGIILGQFARCEVDEEDYTIVQSVMDATDGLNIPVMYNIQSGHSFPMINLPMGAECIMDTDSKSVTFKIER
jgi:muramoyltetrapeptide carboxypeptidase